MTTYQYLQNYAHDLYSKRDEAKEIVKEKSLKCEGKVKMSKEWIEYVEAEADVVRLTFMARYVTAAASNANIVMDRICNDFIIE